MTVRYAVGIDLGTTHCAMARIDLQAKDARTEVVAVPQLVAAGTLDARPLLPSFVYFPPAAEGPQPLPWDSERLFAVGYHARARSVEVPGRVVASAKSWLCHPNLDRRSGLLPLGAPDDLERISPVEASFRYLEHLTEIYDAAFGDESGPLCEQQIVLTVPASFDAAARDLSVEAALAAGLDQLILLEEPQAALYAWLESAGDGWREQLEVGDVVLVMDVGGGTSDFSAIAVQEEEGELSLLRIAVGDHILLGGDNMDLALAHLVRQRLEAGGAKIDGWQVSALSHCCRDGKEKLLADPDCEAVPIVVPQRGAKLVGAALRSELRRDEVSQLILEGFFPQVAASARPAVRPRVGLTRIGLPYAADPAITKHLAAFLARQTGALKGLAGGAAASGMLRPSAVLFNGGVMRSEILRRRLSSTLDAWLTAAGGQPARLLSGADLNLAVARGAAYYGRSREGHGIRIRGGTARAYYVGIESAVPAVPGIEPPISAMCVAPIGMEEGTSAALPQLELGVVVGEPVRFRFFSSSVRRQDTVGTCHEQWADDEIEELAPIEVTLPADERPEGDVVPVHLQAKATEIGTLLLEAVPIVPRSAEERWKIELSVRDVER